MTSIFVRFDCMKSIGWFESAILNKHLIVKTHKFNFFSSSKSNNKIRISEANENFPCLIRFYKS